MVDRLKEVDADLDEDTYTLRPYGLFLMKLEDEALARRVTDALEQYLRKHNRIVGVDNDGLYFDAGLDAEDFAIIRCAIMWRDFTDGMKEKAAQDLEQAVDAARHRTWKRRRDEISQ